MFPKRFLLLSAAVCMAAGLCTPTGAEADIILIDSFNVPPAGHASVATGAMGVVNGLDSVADSLNTNQVLGGSRDLFARKTIGNSDDKVETRHTATSPGTFKYVSDSDTGGWGAVVWDGEGTGGDVGGYPANVLNDLAAPAVPAEEVNFDGLGGTTDLTAGGLATSIDLKVTFSDLGGPVTLTIWDNDDNGASSVSQTKSIGIGSQTISFSFTSFTGNAPPLTVLDSPGAIQMTVDGRATAQWGWDLTLDWIQVEFDPPPPVEVPEPAGLLLGALGLVGVAVTVGRRRQRN
jgi:hypothetical protein